MGRVFTFVGTIKGVFMEVRCLNEKEKQYLSDYLGVLNRSRIKKIVTAAVVLNAMVFLYWIFRKSETFSWARAVVFIAFMTAFGALVMFDVRGAICKLSKFKETLYSFNRESSSFYTAPLFRSENGRFYIEGLDKPVTCAEQSHYGKARLGDEILIVRVSEKEYIGFLRSEIIL